jgi:pyruvate kinase
MRGEDSSNELSSLALLGKVYRNVSPSSDNPETTGRLIDEGMNVCRMNFSHGDHAEHVKQMAAVQDALKIRSGAYCGLLVDTKGPEVRTGNT